MTPFFQDLCYGARQLWRSPGFTMAAIVTLALGTGANTAIFSVVRAVLIRDLPYQDPGRRVMVGHQHAERGSVFGAFSPQDFEDLRAGTTAHSSLAAYWFQSRVTQAGTSRDWASR